jgi:selenocysteine lyase/cysteine desulfurase
MIYLDHAATSWPKPDAVAAAMVRALTDLTANAGRSGHRASLASARLVFQTRQKLAALLGAPQAEDLVFTRGCTEGLNLVLKGFLRPGDRVLVSPLEHNSVMRPLVRLAHDRGVAVETLPADPFGRVDAEQTRALLRQHPAALAAAQHASNVHGAVQDLAALRDALGDVPLLVDAAQTAGVLPINVAQLRLDFLCLSVHKGLLGPTGVGVCWLDPRHEVLPLVEGGTGSQSDSLEHPAFRPDRYEAGTLNLHGIAGTLGALEGLDSRGLLGDHKRSLCRRLIEGLCGVRRVRLHSPTDGTALCVALTVADLPPDRVAARLEREHGVLCRPGLQCAPAAHRHLGTFPQGVVRLSPGWGNTPDEIDHATRGLAAIAGGS